MSTDATKRIHKMLSQWQNVNGTSGDLRKDIAALLMDLFDFIDWRYGDEADFMDILEDAMSERDLRKEREHRN